MPKNLESLTSQPGQSLRAWLLPPGMPFYALIFFFINALFAVKYGARTPLGPVGSVAGYLVFFAIQIGVTAAVSRWASRSRAPWLWPTVFIAVYLIVSLAIYLRMDPEKLQLDRWSALDHFLAALFRGDYPYQARTHLDHPISGFPGLFLLSLPFYLLGDVGYLQFGALIALAVLLVIRLRDGGRPLYLLACVAVMPVFAYQVFCRSDLFGNMVAVAWFLHLGAKPGVARGGRLWLWAIAWGLLLSTRGIVVIPLILAASTLLRGRPLFSLAAFFAVVGVVMFATLVPFYLWDAQLFWKHNPYDVQAGYVSRWVLAAVLLVTAALSWRYRATPRPFFHTGLVLFGTIFVCWILKVVETGWSAMLWGSQFDITYFLLGIPFLLIALGESLPRTSHTPAHAKARS